MNHLFATILLLTTYTFTKAQSTVTYADSLSKVYKIPALGFAVIAADTVFELHVGGVQRINDSYPAKITDRFHIGSNTKAITAFLAALLVKQGKLRWNTRFFDLYPSLKAKSQQAYYDVTLRDLLTFRGKLPGYTYTFEKPAREEITGDNTQQRLQLAGYFLSKDPMTPKNGLTPSNVDYILAGLMLEKAAGKSYKTLVTDFGRDYGINFGFDYPNLSDTLQPWGHGENLQPIPPFDNYKLNWLLTAGNINVSLPDYVKFVQLQLRGLKEIGRAHV